MDSGASWRRASIGLPDGFFFGLYSDESNPGGSNLLLSCLNGVYRSTNYGEEWTITDSIRDIRSFTKSDKYVFACGPSGVYRSADHGQHWVVMKFPGRRWASPIALCGQVLVALSDSGIYRSSDFGDTWLWASNQSFELWPVAYNGKYLFVGTDYGPSYRSSDYGSTWETFTPPGLGNVQDIASKGNYLFAAIGGNPLGQGGAVYYSTDLGETWIKAWQGNGASICSLAFQ
jgi:photosystem II stability/assembly factor-like uncharacterized protein